MENILATPVRRGFAGVSWTTLALGASMLGSTVWGAWATCELLALERREVVTVQLNRVVGEFVEAEARGGRSPEDTRARIETYLKAVEASVAKLGADGRTVLVAEAVVAGSAPDLTDQVRADVARRLESKPTGAGERGNR